MVVDNASRIAVSGECLRVSVEEDQARELLVCGVLLTWLLAPVRALICSMVERYTQVDRR
jgi:hypothetical protein